MTTIGEKIRAARRNRKWTIRVLAIKTGYTQNTIGAVERGEWPPSERLLRTIEKALDPQGKTGWLRK